VGTQTLQAAALNRWRALMCWVSGHGEGWALYAERLMDQLGHLADDGDRLGMLDAQRLRAGRVVLDIGLHCGLPMPEHLAGSAGGAWSVEKAWDFMSAHWGGTEAEQRFELNRYLGWPGQAPAYKIGQRVWVGLREEAETAGPPARDRHRRALQLGGLRLSVLEEAPRRRSRPLLPPRSRAPPRDTIRCCCSPPPPRGAARRCGQPASSTRHCPSTSTRRRSSRRPARGPPRPRGRRRPSPLPMRCCCSPGRRPWPRPPAARAATWCSAATRCSSWTAR